MRIGTTASGHRRLLTYHLPRNDARDLLVLAEARGGNGRIRGADGREPILAQDGYVPVPQRPGLGIDLDWDRLAGHPYERANMLPLFKPGWERRSEAEE